jgi:hypothetical protein
MNTPNKHPFCINCVHYRIDAAYCEHCHRPGPNPKIITCLVSGKESKTKRMITSCLAERRDINAIERFLYGDRCGVKGKYFEPKELLQE